MGEPKEQHGVGVVVSPDGTAVVVTIRMIAADGRRHVQSVRLTTEEARWLAESITLVVGQVEGGGDG